MILLYYILIYFLYDLWQSTFILKLYSFNEHYIPYIIWYILTVIFIRMIKLTLSIWYNSTTSQFTFFVTFKCFTSYQYPSLINNRYLIEWTHSCDHSHHWRPSIIHFYNVTLLHLNFLFCTFPMSWSYWDLFSFWLISRI